MRRHFRSPQFHSVFYLHQKNTLMTKIPSLLILFALLFSLNLSGQQKSRFGIKTGMNVAWQSNNLEWFEGKPLISMHITGFTEVQLTERLFMQPGISLQGKGVSTDSGIQNDAWQRTNLTYVEIPINLLYKFAKTSRGNFFIGGGPYAGLGISGKEENGSANVFRGIDGSNGYGNTDYGINLLVGTELSSRLSLSLQQSIGLDNVAPEPYTVPGPADGPVLINGTIKNRVASFSIGYRF
jgi:hypothetical protein